MNMKWSDAWGTQLVSGLSLLAGRYDTALVANDLPYAWLGIPWPSHPVTDVLLGSKGFSVINDGGEFSRAEKAKVISQWPEAMRHLRVCFGLDIPGSHENCCRCEKCTRTMLAFRVAGCPRPAAFKDDASDRQIRRMRWNLPKPDAEMAGAGARRGCGRHGRRRVGPRRFEAQCGEIDGGFFETACSGLSCRCGTQSGDGFAAASSAGANWRLRGRRKIGG